MRMSPIVSSVQFRSVLIDPDDLIEAGTVGSAVSCVVECDCLEQRAMEAVVRQA